MREILEKSAKHGVVLDMIYLSKSGQVSKRRVKAVQMGESSFRAYCFLRGSRRTFVIDNVLALVPLIEKESMVI